MLPVAKARSSSDGNAICYVLPVSWMTSIFHIMGHIQIISHNTNWVWLWGQIVRNNDTGRSLLSAIALFANCCDVRRSISNGVYGTRGHVICYSGQSWDKLPCTVRDKRTEVCTYILKSSKSYKSNRMFLTQSRSVQKIIKILRFFIKASNRKTTKDRFYWAEETNRLKLH